MSFTMKDVYSIMLKDFPDLMDIEQTSKALGVSTKTVYKLLKAGKLAGMKVGRAYRVPKIYLLSYLKVLDTDHLEKVS